MYIILLTVLIVYQGVIAIWDYIEMKQFRKTGITEQRRLTFYRDEILYGVIPAAVVFLFMLFTPMTPPDIGFRAVQFTKNMWLTIPVLAVCGGFFLLLVYQAVMFIMSKEFRCQSHEQTEKHINSGKEFDTMLQVMMPVTKREKRWWFFVSLTAGVCEETTWRGCFLFVIVTLFPVLSPLTAGIASCVLFGLFHSYQGISGVVRTTLVGAVFLLLYYASGSLILPIVLHFASDVSSAFALSEDK